MLFFCKKHSKEKAFSLSTLTWKRFKKERLGMISLFFLCLVFLMAILGYLITPDQTPNCNEQHLEIALQSPGFSVFFLNTEKEQPVKDKCMFQKMLFGQPAIYNSVPLINEDIEMEVINNKGYNDFNRNTDSNSVFCRKNSANLVAKGFDDKNTFVRKKTFWLGTDRYGRDVLSQLMLGARISLSVGIIAVFIALLIGVFVGAIAGYYGGKTDALLTWLINVVWSIPTLLLVIAISFALGKGFWQIFIAIGLTMWVDIARVVRGQTLALKQQDFVEAGRALGFSNMRIIFKHILPNIFGTLVVLSAANFSSAILMEAGLSFLGMGVQPPIPSWGMMMKENYAYIVLDKAYLAIIPGIAIMMLVFAFMLIGSALRNAMEVRK
ncbi:MAG: ABC transporter permease [Bacteroidales bacterium]|jgi:peptide/nickel transport system permease protein|nr:ABC transporter permease [Bacteroidales bacterium]